MSPGRSRKHTHRGNSVRISGAVKAMNTARRRLSEGIPPAEAPQFRRWVTQVVDQIETICRANRIRPEQLLPPTYRAYLYLRSIDLQNLPPPQEDVSAPAAPVRIRNLVALTRWLQEQLQEIAAAPQEQRPQLRQSALRSVQETWRQVENKLQAAGAGLEALPAPSRRACQWLRCLSQPAHFDRHISALQQVQQAAGRILAAARKPRGVQFQAEFAHIPSLYRVTTRGRTVKLTASEAYTGAPPQVLEDLARAALLGRDRSTGERLKAYSESAAFQQALGALEGEPVSGGRGSTYDLQQVFARVNAEYFDGKMPAPRLVWNSTITHRKLGHYQFSSDTVLISITLDTPQTPEYVIDYVMYHELLHKALGVQVVNGRRYAHTPAFRRAERRFRYYNEAQEYLQKLGQSLS